MGNQGAPYGTRTRVCAVRERVVIDYLDPHNPPVWPWGTLPVWADASRGNVQHGWIASSGRSGFDDNDGVFEFVLSLFSCGL
jgi:hypothetical protein